MLAAGEDTGSHEVFVQVVPPGAGAPLHSHPWSEAFYVRYGNLNFWTDEPGPEQPNIHAIFVTPGEFVRVEMLVPFGCASGLYSCRTRVRALNRRSAGSTSATFSRVRAAATTNQPSWFRSSIEARWSCQPPRSLISGINGPIFCREELRLNRRFAPELYLDVYAITAFDGDPQIEGQAR